jgi:hypothetical protein
MQVFIVRPFGNRPVLKKDKTGNVEKVMFDFDAVEKDLIRPALKQTNLSGGTTGEIFEAGDIREDMFSLLLQADLVIADITVHNANVFYELGIRHALRDKRTVLIKCSGYDETPFDITGYRYLSYQKDNPSASLNDLVQTIQSTLNTDRKDSPVFNILPNLKPQDPEVYQAMPEDFIEEVTIASESKNNGRLALLAFEVSDFGWKLPAYRLIGDALFKNRSFVAASKIWEEIKVKKPSDIQANDRLATIYQRLAETETKTNPNRAIELLIKSDLAIEAVIKSNTISNYQRAEAFALKARNIKTRWLNTWKDIANYDQRTETALQSIYLETSLKNYEKGFYEDLNHFYSGINALGLLVIIVSLAEENSIAWENLHESPDEAELKLSQYKKRLKKICAALDVSLEAAKKKLDEKGETDIWMNVTEADFSCLTETNSLKVEAKYKQIVQMAKELNLDAVVRQLKIYQSLGVKIENINAALKVFPDVNEQPQTTNHYLLFTGHMIDKADRKEPRFPAAKEAAVKKSIKEKVVDEKNKLASNTILTGIAGGACGGDILFHEVCAELGISTQLFLALPEDQFKVESVAFAGNGWIERFEKLYQSLPYTVLSKSKTLPAWLHKKDGYNIWERNNLWELNSVLINGGINMTLIALWDGKDGDGPGGTQHMVKIAGDKGAKVVIMDISKI